jgi:hypothetical protein
MANGFYNHGNLPGDNTPGSSAEIRAEFDAVEAGFGKLPALTSNADKVVVVNAGETALTVKTQSALVSETIHAATTKATPVAADEFGFWDSVSSAFRKLTFANLLTVLGNTFAAFAGSASQVFSVAAATAAAHAVRADQIQGASLTAYTATLTGTEFAATPAPAITAYVANQTFNLIFASACPAAPTLKLNGIATPPNLVKQNINGTYSNLAANDFPAGWQSQVKLVSATQALVMKLPEQSSGTVTLTLTGCTTSPTIDLKWVKIGKVVTISPNANNISGTSNSTSKTLTGLPSSLAPSATYYDHGISVDNGGAATISAVNIVATGAIGLQPTTASATWTASGIMIFYPKSYTYVTA